MSRSRHIAVAIAATVIALAGCGGHGQPAPEGRVVTLPNGHAVSCVLARQAVTCDWASWAGKAN